MPGNALKAFAWLTGAGAIAGIAYTAFALARIRAFRKAAADPARSAFIPVTILKPLYRDEPHLFENLCSFCDQDYGDFQIVFGARDPGDPALDVARAVKERFPDRDIEIVAGNGKPAANPKVGNLLGLVDRARHPLIVIADSDIRAGREYLQVVAGCFSDSQVGAATCPYGAVPEAPLASLLGAMYVNDQFTPSVLVATAIEPLTYCFGATIAVRRDVLKRIGGLDALADHLGDDYYLGKLVTQAGYRIALIPYAVQTTVTDASISALWMHELRWARTILKQRPAGYAGSIITYALPLGAFFAIAARSPLAYLVFALAAGLRAWLHFEAGKTLSPQARSRPWLIPVRDFFGVAVWVASFFGRRVQWKDDAYQVGAGGRMAVGPKEL